MVLGSLGKVMAHSKWSWEYRLYKKWSKSLEEVGMWELMYIMMENPPADYIHQEGLGKT